MVYRRRYAGRRTTRSRRRTLSSYSIATRTSARAQSRQIYAINRRISGIQRRTRPEIKSTVINGTSWSVSSTNETHGQLVSYGIAPTPIDGNFARLQSATAYFSARYTNAPETTSSPVTFRIVGIQTKTTRSSDMTNTDVFYGVVDGRQQPPEYADIGMNGPLHTGLGRIGKVLFDRKFYLSFQRPCISTKLRMRRLLNYYKSETEGIAKGHIYIFILAYAPIVGTSYTFDLNSKIAYTDA